MIPGIAVLVWWTYAPALESYLVTDDFQWLSSAMQFSFVSLFDIGDRTHFYRPVIELYFGVMFAMTSCSAQALHAVSLVLHIANATLAMWLARSMTGSTALAALAALLFAVQPAPAQAVLWPAAVSAVLSVTFGLAMLKVDVERARRPGGMRAAAVALLFAAALGAHESAIMLLPIALLLRHAAGEQRAPTQWLREYWVCLLVVSGYVVLTAWINSRNYVVTEGQYALGWHMIDNLANYLVALWAGRRVALDYAVTFGLLGMLLWKGPRHIRAWTLWLIAALVPVLPFVGPTASRYTYMASVPFSLLLAAGITWAYHVTKQWTGRERSSGTAAAMAVAAVLLGFVSVRSATFARKGADGFRSDAAPFEQLARQLRTQSGRELSIGASSAAWIDSQYLVPLARVARCDPQVTVDVH